MEAVTKAYESDLKIETKQIIVLMERMLVKLPSQQKACTPGLNRICNALLWRYKWYVSDWISGHKDSVTTVF